MLPYVDPAERVARVVYKVGQLYPIQRFVIANTLDGADQIVVLPTGSGKSLCYQVPIQLLTGLTVVVVPLLALLRDQKRRLDAAGVPSAAFHGGQSMTERNQILGSIRAAHTRAVFTTPEFLAGSWALSMLPALEICHLVVDEAHCMVEWGDTFRPAYRQLGAIAGRLGNPLTTAFTATAAPHVLERIREILFFDKSPRMVLGNPDRPNIHYAVVPTVCRDQDILALTESESGPTVVFSRTRRGVERHARVLHTRLNGREIRLYHAGLSSAERRRVEQWFLGSSDGILVASSAYGLGVDKAGIRLIVHAEVPLSVEAYLQESGRAGRDGGPSRAVLLWSAEDAGPPSGLVADEISQARYGAMIRYARSAECRRSVLMRLMGQREPVCSGCDVCRGQQTTEARGTREILALIGRHKRRFTARQISLILAGWRIPEITQRGYHGLPWFGALSRWDAEEIDEAVRGLINAGLLVDSRIFRHRLRAHKT